VDAVVTLYMWSISQVIQDLPPKASASSNEVPAIDEGNGSFAVFSTFRSDRNLLVGLFFLQPFLHHPHHVSSQHRLSSTF
jgi:hypothetical protein